MGKCALAIHGGCGVMRRTELPEEDWSAAQEDLARALRSGWAVLSKGESAVDAVEAAVRVLEDSEHFNAGYGAVLNAAGEHELDAAIMDGATLRAGAISAARRVRNPVAAARAVMESGDLVMLTGPAADTFAGQCGVDIVDPSYFTTPRRLAALQAMKAHEAAGTATQAREAEKHGTVGAVALDQAGHLAAATSTGGYTNKPAGRVGDSPIIGAGTYARDGACAVSGTGKGELFIRHVLGHEIASRMAYLGETLATAADQVIRDLQPYQAGAGLVAVDRDGTIVAPFNTEGMYRGWITVDGELFVGTHADINALPLLLAN
jgi:beta-aspartyl-peptidase (threonine type)